MTASHEATAPHLVLVTPDTQYESFHDWLSSDKGMDRVHPIGGRDELLTNRLGHEGDSKRCYALVNNAGSVLSVIYTHWINAVETDKPWEILPGKILPILEAKSEPVEAPNLVTFYSISSFADKSGRPLIASIYNEFTNASEPPILTTLSPLRTLAEWMKKEDVHLKGTEDAKLNAVAAYLKLKQDPVQKFHLGNGAQIGAIHFNASAKGHLDYELGGNVMVSYRYPRAKDRLGENQGILKSGKIPCSYHLQDFFL